MANENKPSGSPIETRLGSESVHSIEMGHRMPEGQKPQAVAKSGAGLTADFVDGGVNIHESDVSGNLKKPEGDGGDQQQQQDGEKKPGEGSDAEGQAEGEALPEFKADDPEVVAKYDAAFVTDKGAPNMAALSAEWWKAAKRDEATGEWSGGLPDGVYDWLESKGFSKETIKGIEAGQIARQVQKEQAVYERAGGADVMKEAIAWATKGNGYTEAMRSRYMDAIKGSDQNAIDEQVDLLVNRFQKATGKGPLAQRRQTQAKPDRTMANAAGTGAPSGETAEPYPDYAAYSKELRAAKSENDQQKLNKVRARLRASPWHNGGK